MMTMKKIAIFRNAPAEGPGFLADFLDGRNLPWELIRVDEGEAIPQDAAFFSGLVFMGGPMSVNDDLPWIPQVLKLIGQAVGRDVPVLGHCLGGQLLAKAMGGSVVANGYQEIGWGRVIVENNDTARSWFGSVGAFDAFHWHGETFNLPLGAAHLLSGEHCTNQAFAIGKHLGLQCHIEMTADMIRDWCASMGDDLADNSGSPAVQSMAEMQLQMADKLSSLHGVAERLYERWISGLAA
jgi:GMP synthase-like glutamine amidotransferase